MLDVSNCNLGSIPASLCSCKSLEELSVSQNPLRGGLLPSWLDELVSLKVLLADEVGLSVLPFALSTLNRLETLSIRNNKMVQLPTWLHLTSNLQRLCLEGNPFYAPWLTILAPLLSASVEVAGPADMNTLRPRACSAPLTTIVSELDPAETPRGSMMRAVSATSAYNADSPVEASFNKPLPPVGPAVDKPLPPVQLEDSLRTSSDELEGGLREAVLRPRTSTGDLSSKWAFSLRRKSKRDLSKLMLPVNSLGLTSARSSIISSPFSAATTASSPEAVDAPMEEGTPSGFLRRSRPQMDSRKRKARMSYLSLTPSPHTPGFTPGDPGEQAHEEHSKRVKALMHYLRDLDDLCSEQQQQQSFMNAAAESDIHRLRRMQSAGALSTSAVSTRSSEHGPGSPISSRRPSEANTPYLSHSYSSASSTNGFTTPEEALAPPVPALPPSLLNSKDEPMRRQKVIAEIISSEETYVRGLQELAAIYIQPASQPLSGSSGAAAVPISEQKTVFGNIEALLHFHQGGLLPSLKAAAAPILAGAPETMTTSQSSHIAEDVANVFVRHAAFFRMYSTYINNCDAAQTRVAAWLAPMPSSAASAFKVGGNSVADGELTSAQRKAIKKFLKRARADSRHSQISIESYLLLPVQRIPRYRLLLEDLVRSTPSHLLRNPSAVQDALVSIRDIANTVNESKRQAEQDKRLWEWQDKITGHWPSPLVQPHRKLIKDGPLVIRRVVKRSIAYVQTDAAAPGEQLGNSVSAVDVLQQQPMNKPVFVLLCNDIAVILSTPTAAKGSKSFFELYAVMRIRQEKGCDIIGENSESGRPLAEQDQLLTSSLPRRYTRCRPQEHLLLCRSFAQRGEELEFGRVLSDTHVALQRHPDPRIAPTHHCKLLYFDDDEISGRDRYRRFASQRRLQHQGGIKILVRVRKAAVMSACRPRRTSPARTCRAPK